MSPMNTTGLLNENLCAQRKSHTDMYDIVMLSSATLAGGLPIIVRGVDAPPVQISNQRSELPVSIIAYERTRDKF
jgi:hypothetical protein